MNARDFAIKAHGEQMYGDKPYVYHLDEVAELVRESCPLDLAVDVAYLHDVVEDTDVTFDDLYKNFCREVVKAVYFVTDHEGKNRKEKKAITYAYMAAYDVYTHIVPLTVKLMDRFTNVKNCIICGNSGLLKMYKKEHDAFKKAVYREGFLVKYQQLLDGMLESKF